MNRRELLAALSAVPFVNLTAGDCQPFVLPVETESGLAHLPGPPGAWGSCWLEWWYDDSPDEVNRVEISEHGMVEFGGFTHGPVHFRVIENDEIWTAEVAR